jgi:hypothetical protein
LSINISVSNLFSFQFVNCFHKNILVLELVTFGSKVQLVVDVLVDLFAVTILLQQSSKDSCSADSKDFAWHTGITGTLSVTGTLMTTLALFGLVSLNT